MDRVDAMHLVDADLRAVGTGKADALSGARTEQLMKFLRAWCQN
jgi:hypothetical protein